MRPSRHVAVSAVAATAFGLVTKSWAGSYACFLGGIFIDIDHYFDFWLNRGKIIWNYRDLSFFCGRERKGKMVLIFHSYELMVLFWAAILYYGLGPIWLGIAIGMSFHLICDQMTNPIRLYSYFLTYRIRHRFSKEQVFLPEAFQQETKPDWSKNEVLQRTS